MAWHVLGWLTVASQIGGAAFLCRYLFNAGREPRTWLHRVPVPRAVKAPLVLSSGSDYVGRV